MVTHWAACVIYFIGYVQDFNSLTLVGAYALTSSLVDTYIETLYWAIVTLTTVGYGDLSSGTTAGFVFCILYMTFNLGIVAYILGNVTILVGKNSLNALKHGQDASQILELGRSKSIDPQLVKTLLKQLEMEYNSTFGEEASILKTFPSTIQNQVERGLYFQTLRDSTIFANTASDFITFLMRESPIELYASWTNVIQKGEVTSEFYIILMGTVNILYEDKSKGKEVNVDTVADISEISQNILCELHPGYIFGTEAFFSRAPAEYNVETSTGTVGGRREERENK